MLQSIITVISILLPFLLALYGRHIDKPTSETLVFTKAPVPYFLN